MALLNTLSEQELLSLLNQGKEEDAFEEIYLRYDSLLYIYAYRKLQNKQEAQDVVQEVFMKLWDNRATLSFCNPHSQVTCTNQCLIMFIIFLSTRILFSNILILVIILY